uniref:ELMO domain-containing protein n=2 Tax=Leersia perrieri TaxID=77586 RepID=A0A0D9XWG5_9ORYZ
MAVFREGPLSNQNYWLGLGGSKRRLCRSLLFSDLNPSPCAVDGEGKEQGGNRIGSRSPRERLASTTTRKVPHTADIDRSEKQMETIIPDSVREPLLGNSVHESKSERYEPDMQPDLWDGKRQEHLGWMHLISSFICRSVRRIGNAISQIGSLLARFFSWSFASHGSNNGQAVLVDLSPLQEGRLRFLRQRLSVPFDSSSVTHQDALKELWRLDYPSRQLPPLKSDLWKEMGWQNSDPATDFRAGGFISLENLIYFARNYADSFHRLLHKADGKRAEWEYPFAVAGNYSLYLFHFFVGKMTTKASSQFVQQLTEDEMAFDNLFCVAFQMLDAQWLTRQASYMEFNDVLKSTRIQLEQELSIGRISTVKEMPSFRLLKRVTI